MTELQFYLIANLIVTVINMFILGAAIKLWSEFAKEMAQRGRPSHDDPGSL